MRKQTLGASHCTGIWIPRLNKDKSVDIQKQFLEQRMQGMVLSYQAVTTTRITYNAFDSCNKEGKEWCYLIQLAPTTSVTCNILFL